MNEEETAFRLLQQRIVEVYNELEELARKAHIGNHVVSVEVRGRAFTSRRTVVIKVQR